MDDVRDLLNQLLLDLFHFVVHLVHALVEVQYLLVKLLVYLLLMRARIQIDDLLIYLRVPLLESWHAWLCAPRDLAKLLHLLADEGPLVHLLHLEDVRRLVLALQDLLERRVR